MVALAGLSMELTRGGSLYVCSGLLAASCRRLALRHAAGCQIGFRSRRCRTAVNSSQSTGRRLWLGGWGCAGRWGDWLGLRDCLWCTNRGAGTFDPRPTTGSQSGSWRDVLRHGGPGGCGRRDLLGGNCRATRFPGLQVGLCHVAGASRSFRTRIR